MPPSDAHPPPLPSCPYATLGVPRSACLATIKAAFRSAARRTHPDRSDAASAADDSGAAFAAVRAAYELLADSRRRAAHDACASAAPGGVAAPPAAVARADAARAAARAPRGGEGGLLSALGPAVLPACQLVVTCEACRRPATCACWVCGMDLCAFCTRTPHWKGATAMHWPLINTPNALSSRLARRELEAKRVEDAAAEEVDAPGWVSPADRAGAAAFAAALEAAGPAARTSHVPALARYYLWDQTPSVVVVAVHVPAGRGRVEVGLDGGGGRLTVRRAGGPPVLDRALARRACPSTRPAVAVTADGRTAVIVLAKAEPGKAWRALFDGDSDGVRCVVAPYRVSQPADDGGTGGGSGDAPPPPSTVSVDLPLPWWVRAEDVAVDCTPDALTITAAGGAAAAITRRFWAGRGRAVLPGETAWSLEAPAATTSPSSPSRPPRTLTIVLTRPPPTPDEVAWHRGRRQDNRSAARPGCAESSPGAPRGAHFFACDDDWHGLEGPLAGGMVAVGGVGTLRGDPLDGGGGRAVRCVGDLPAGGVGVWEVLSGKEGGGVSTPTAGGDGPRPASEGDDDDDDDVWEF